MRLYSQTMKKRISFLRLLVCGAIIIGASAFAPRAHAGWWENFRARMGISSSASSDKRESARAARERASQLNERAQTVKSKLGGVQRTLLRVNRTYFDLSHQLKRTEAQIVRERHRKQIVTERYNRRRELFGRRLAAMQRSGQVGYLQVFLGSSTLSDLTRRVYLFRALVDRDAHLQADLKSDKAELEEINNNLAREWNKRYALQRDAQRERARVAQAAAEQNAALKKLVNSRNELLNYSSNREQEIKQIDIEIAAYNARQREMARQAAIEEAEQEREDAAYERAQASRRSRVASYSTPRSSYRSSSSTRRNTSYSSSSSTRRSRSRRTASSSSSSRPRQQYRNVQVAKRVNRTEYVRVPSLGGVLKPMSIPEIVFKNERVPVASGNAAGTARDDSARSDNSSSKSKSSGPPPPATDDFPASDP